MLLSNSYKPGIALNNSQLLTRSFNLLACVFYCHYNVVGILATTSNRSCDRRNVILTVAFSRVRALILRIITSILNITLLITSTHSNNLYSLPQYNTGVILVLPRL
jgi:hypothetical protein